MYLLAIVLANFSVFWFGKAAVIINAFVFIGLDLSARDSLHNKWRGKNLVVKMGTLITVGSLLTWILNKDAGQIALASIVAFTLSAIADTIVYHKTNSVNKSNIVSAAIDSIIFPTLAFGAFFPMTILGQWIAKVVGGFVWCKILNIEKHSPHGK